MDNLGIFYGDKGFLCMDILTQITNVLFAELSRSWGDLEPGGAEDMKDFLQDLEVLPRVHGVESSAAQTILCLTGRGVP